MRNAAQIDLGPNHELLVLEGPVYVVRLRNVPTGNDVRRAIDRLEANPRFRARFGMVFVVTPELTGYDTSLLEVYRHDRPRRTFPELMGVVVRTQLQRMVVSAVAVGYRMATKRSFAVYDTEDEAVDAARAMLRRS